MRVTSLETARRAVEYECKERFPEDKWHIVETRWADGDFEVKAIHSTSQTEDGNSMREEIICTPFNIKFEVVEITQSQSWKTHHEEILENED